MEPDEVPLKLRSKRSATISKREAPYVIYPEILVIVDYDGYRLVQERLEFFLKSFCIILKNNKVNKLMFYNINT